MAVNTVAFLLVVLSLLATPVHPQSDPCDTANAVSGNTNFHLSVTPLDFSTNTSYNVTVDGSSNFTSVQLQAVDSSSNTSLGQWSSGVGVSSCPSGHLLYNASSSSVTVQWTSPNVTAPVEIRAFIAENGTLFLLKRELTQASTVPPVSANTTAESSNATNPTNSPAPNQTSANSTGSAATVNGTTVTSMTTKGPSSTTKSGSDRATYSGCILIAIVHSMLPLLLSGRQAS
ncbi:uncharacterized protein [Ambystoma mexicanum]|uniref:uncharacterized protein n=1 Tax=Ambystoma mexicanum TaxID=8296 RepID=UPI0037E7CB9B